MIGVKGVGMTMLAQFLSNQGCIISGSDTDEKFMTDKVLKRAGIKVVEKFDKKHINKDLDLIVYSSAYNKETNEELKYALRSKIKTINYAQATSDVFNHYKGIAISGSHGKTTVSAWLSFVAQEAKLSPNALIGSNVPQLKGSCLNGSSQYLIAEVDEYQNKLKYFNPWMVVLNNIDHDHHDYFKTKQQYISVFNSFLKKIPKQGRLIANFDDPLVKRASKYCKGKIISYAINQKAKYVAKNIRIKGRWQYFDVNRQKDFKIQLAGQHNISNALAVILASKELCLSWESIKDALTKFKGAERRLEFLGKFKGACIIDDYAHHPTEVKGALEAVHQLYSGKLITVFHPHTYTRTKSLLKEFAKSFKETDELIILDIYGSAREEQGGVSSMDLLKKIRQYNQEQGISQKLKHISNIDQCSRYLRTYLQKGDILLLMGAGDVFRVGKKLLRKV